MSIKKFTLSNGITVIHDRRKVLTSAFCFSVNTGSANELKHYGISHLIEHLMFKSTAKRTAQEINQQIKFTGAISNAYTAYGRTCFWFESLPKYFETVLDVYADFLTSKCITDEEFSKEKDVVLQEIAMYKDDDTEVNFDNMFKRAFGLHPVGGYTKTVQNITKEEVLEYIAKTYTPNNITISVCSNLFHYRLKQMLEKYFNCLKNNDLPESYNDKPSKKIKSYFEKAVGTTRKVKKELNQTKICMIVPLNSYSTIKTKMIRHILLQIMCRGLSSIMYRVLREEKGLFYRLSAEIFYKTSDFEQPYLLMETSTEPKNIKQLLKNIKKILASMDSYITKEDFQKALNILEMQSIKETSFDIAEDNIDLFNIFKNIYSDRQLDKILASITFKDIVEEAKSWSKNKMIVQMLG